MKNKNSKVPPVKAPTLFALEEACAAPREGKIERPYRVPGIHVGTSAFTAKGWAGSFFPAGMRPAQYLSHYATQFEAVEIDSTYYGTPSVSTVNNWYAKTPSDFIFAAKVPQVITHEKLLVDCEADLDEFIGRMNLLREKLGPLLLQFPFFNKYTFASANDFLPRLQLFLKRLKSYPGVKLALEIRNKSWLDERFTDLLREHNVALALTDQSLMPRPTELFEKFDPITADFTYVRWLGDRKAIEEQTAMWDKTIIDRTVEISEWVAILKRVIARGGLKAFAFANNHYAGHGPATVKLFRDRWNDELPPKFPAPFA
ncbi:MAG TPA: DUF72 domain-containing protein [Candidatus Saccharimonadales bacterium]|nr:DUF72 domain-containing protein [Candidatus Saccharimonadales bacterium]